MKHFIFLLILFVAGCGPAMDANNFQRADNMNSNAPTNTNSVITGERQNDKELALQLDEIANEANGRVGVHAYILNSEKWVSVNADERFAMQSVVKLPISMAVLRKVETGDLKLDQQIAFTKDEVLPGNFRSPIREKYPNGGEQTVRELIEHAMMMSDGTAADVLQRIAGGAEGVQKFLILRDIDGINVKYTHKEFANSPERQYENWATPRGAVFLLLELHKALDPPDTDRAASAETHSAAPPFISPENAKLLQKFMTETPTGPNRLKGMLPQGTVVAHKTGTSGTVNGVTAATNDVGIITLPSGRQFAIAVFVADSPADEKTREAVIAKIAKAIWDKWSA